MDSFARFASSRAAAWILIPVFLLAAVGLGSLQPKLQEKSDQASGASWLPQDSDSARALKTMDESLDGSDRMSGVLLFAEEDGLALTDLQRREIFALIQTIDEQRTSGALRRVTSIARPDRLPPDAKNPFVSREGSTVIAPITIRAESFPEADPVATALRSRIEESPAGVDAHLTGELGVTVDAVEVIGSIDGNLLIATVALVLTLLLLLYRSPVIALVPVITVALAYAVAAGLAYLLSETTDIQLNAQTTGILIVLMFGAGTDYCLLLVARYRDELHRHERPREAMREALRHTTMPILMSGLTVIAAMLMLLLATYGPNHDMGPVLALGVAITLVAGLTLLPALLCAFGRRAFWPAIPRYDQALQPRRRTWSAISGFVDRRPSIALTLPVLVLCVLALGNTTDMQPVGWGSSDAFRATTDSGEGLERLESTFPAGAAAPNLVVVDAPDPAIANLAVDDIREVLQERDSASRLDAVDASTDGNVRLLEMHLQGDPYSQEAADEIQTLRKRFAGIEELGNLQILIGGPAAQNHDTQQATNRDERVVIPLVLVTIFLLLTIMLRAVVAPLHIIASVVLSFAATVGASMWLFDNVFDEPGIAGGYSLFIFIFVVALGVDYNIFLISRIREETVRSGSTRIGAIAGLAATGGIITSAGLILAGTFSVLAVMPLLMLFQMGFGVALGVLIDTFVVRSLIVPASVRLLGERNWWPGRTPGSERNDDSATGTPPEGEQDPAPHPERDPAGSSV